MSQTNFQKIILEEILIFFQPIKEGIDTDKDTIELFDKLGYDIVALTGNNIAPITNKLKAISSALSAITNLLSGNALLNIADTISSFSSLVSIPNLIQTLNSGFPNSIQSINDPETNTPITSKISEDLLSYLAFIYLSNNHIVFTKVLILLGVIHTDNSKPINYNGKSIRIRKDSIVVNFGKLVEIITNPSELKKDYFENSNGITTREEANKSANLLFGRLNLLLVEFDIEVFLGNGDLRPIITQEEQEILEGMIAFQKTFEVSNNMNLDFGLKAGLIPDPNPNKQGIFFAPFGAISIIEIIGKWMITVKASAQSSGMEITGEGITFYDPSQSDFKFVLSAESVRDAGDPVFHIGSMTGTRFEVDKMAFNTFLELMPPDKYYGFMIGLPQMKFVLKGGDGDGFLAKVLGNGIDVNLNFEIGWSNKDGVHLKGGGGLEKYFPEKKTIGPVDFVGLRLGVGVKFGTNVVTSIPLYASSDVKVRFGKSLTLLVESVGMQMEISFPNGDKNFGIFQVDFGFKAPSGIGIKIDSTAITGEGYLHWKDGEYIGAISLNLKNSGLTITAIGILSTKLPTGEEGYSLMVIAGVEGLKIALGMGFFITAIGGMLGLHRTMDKDAIREGLRANSLASILFPRNILENIYKIVSDINTLFPIKKDQFLIAPMARISWPSSEESFINGDLGLVIEVGSSFNIGILGRVWSRLPDEENDLIRLNVSFFGVIDFDKGELYFDAAIYDSRFTILSIEGDIALRIFWGAQKEFLLSVGGFHPQFKPSASLKVSHMKRITIALLTDNPSLIIQFYFAITSNSLQFGARADFRFDAGVCEVKGGFGLDALIQFSPFYFTVSIYAYLGVYAFGGCALAINLNGQLSGPGPWNFRGNASFDLCWFISVSVNIDVTWGDSAPPPLPSVKVSPLIVEEFKKLENWNVLLPNEKQSLVKLKKYTDRVVIDPMGILRVSQRIVPIEKKIDIFGGQPVMDGSKGYKISKIRNVTNNDEGLDKKFNFQSFASAQFFNYSNEQKLAIPSYEDHPAGIDIGDKAYSIGGMVQTEVQYETAIIDTEVAENIANHSSNKYNNSFVDFKKFLKGNHVATSEIATQHRLSTIDIGQVQLGKVGFEIVNNYTHSLLNNTKYSTYTEAQQVIDAMVAVDPRNIGKWSVQED